MDQRLKSAKWVAETFGLPLQRVYELTRREIIPAVRILRQYRYDPTALAEWAKQGGTAAKSESPDTHRAQGS